MIEAMIGEHDDVAHYRVIVPAYAGTPMSGMGADDATVLGEYKQDNPWIQPGTICTFFIRQLRVADFSAGFDPGLWPAVWADFAIDWRAEWFDKSIEPSTWYMADDVVASGLDGILFPSQARPGGTNRVIYRSSERSASQLRVYDPDGALQKIDPSVGSWVAVGGVPLETP
ncbi:RES domain-containing protein [Agrobacterium rosae]|uniref:RES domain-containing protein n=1 Tax=Agrobacterium rosae TaxID=1972867 RepID=UPI003D790C04